jgi:hypothetical protein
MRKEIQNTYDSKNDRIERIRNIVKKNRNHNKKINSSACAKAEHPSLKATGDQTDDSKLIYIGGIAGMQEELLLPGEGPGFLHFAEEAESVAIGLLEEHSFYVFRTDTNAVLARGIQGFETAKVKANQLRKLHGLKWDQVRFKVERGNHGTATGAATTANRTSQRQNQLGVSPDGRSFTNAYGERRPLDYSRNFNPSKGRRFRGYYDKSGNYHDID